MTKTDVWQTAGTLGELGELTAQWLEGKLSQTPTYGEPDEETTEIRDTLICLNRAGYVTTFSQPGQPEEPAYDGRPWVQRAGLCLVAAPEPAVRMWAFLTSNGMIGVADPWSPVPVTIHADEPYTWVTPDPIDDLVAQFPAGCSIALISAMPVAFVDPTWGVRGAMWPLLDDYLAR